MRALFLVLIVVAAGWMLKERFAGGGEIVTASKETLQESATDPVVEGIEARLYLNSLRQKAGLGTFYANTELEKAAAAHAGYLAKNRTDGHGESPSLPGFTGEDPAQRALAAGYSSRLVNENLSSGNLDFKDSVDGLFGAIYHRFGFLDPLMDEIGIAYAMDGGGRRIYVYDMGNYRINALCSENSFSGLGRYMTGVCADESRKIGYSKYQKAVKVSRRHTDEIIVWPYEGQSDVPPAFYEEIPDPLPGFSVSGYPISIIFNRLKADGAKISSFKLYDEKSREVPVRLMDANSDPNHLLKKNQYAIFPLKRLEYETRYTASVHYISKGREHHKEWSFTTRSFDVPLLKISSKESSFEIVPKKSYVIYFEPRGPNDLLREIRYPQGAAVEQIDPNTFRLEVGDERVLPFSVTASGRKVSFRLSKD